MIEVAAVAFLFVFGCAVLCGAASLIFDFAMECIRHKKIRKRK